MKYLLNIIYLCLFAVALPAVAMVRWYQGKSLRSWPAKFLGRAPENTDTNSIWLHAVSVGEVNLLGPVVAQLQQQSPDKKLWISVTTDTGYDLAQSKFPDCHVFYCPWDFSWAIQRVIQKIKPSCLVLAELEIWPNLIGIAHQQEIPVVVVNARLGMKSFRGYQRFSFFTRHVFSKIRHVAAQNEAYAVRFQRLGVPPKRISITGSVKFDGACLTRDTEQTLAFRKLSGMETSDDVLMAGSTQDGEDIVVIEAYQKLLETHPELRLIIAPRHPHRASQIASLLESVGLNPRLRSECMTQCAKDQVLIIDTIGELSDWWGVATIAFVGGSLGNRGGQNMIEPAAKGCTLCFGPNTKNFKQVVELFLENNLATVVHNASEMVTLVKNTLAEKEQTYRNYERARELILQQQGATAKTVDTILLMSDAETTPPSFSNAA